MVTRYADLIDLATDQLQRSRARLHHPTATNQPPQQTAEHLTYIAHCLAHLGTTIGTSTTAQHNLLHQLSPDTPPTRPTPGTGPCPTLAQAATMIRASADLIASNGTPTDNPTNQLPPWQHPRPAHLNTPAALASAWADIASLTTTTADMALTIKDHPIRTLARTWVTAAQAIPTTGGPHPPLDTATAGWALPHTQAGPGELDARIHELTAIGWALSQPPQAHDVHPARLLTQIALLGSTIYRTAARTAPAFKRHALDERDHLWRTIHRDLSAIQTPNNPTPDQRRTLTRALILIDSKNSPPQPDDLTAAQAAINQVAEWIIPALTNMTTSTSALINGDLISREMAATSRHLATAKLERTTIQAHPTDLDSITNRLTQAAQPPRPNITTTHTPTQHTRSSNVIPLHTRATTRR